MNDPRHRRRRLDQPGAALSAAHRLEAAADELRAATRDQQPDPEPAPLEMAGGVLLPELAAEDPPTGLLDLGALRQLLGMDPGGEVNPASLDWLAGGTGATPEPAEVLAADVVTAAQLGTVGPPLTAQDFAAALGPEPSVLEAFVAADTAAGRLEPEPDAAPELPTLAELYRAEGADFLAGVLEAEPEPDPADLAADIARAAEALAEVGGAVVAGLEPVFSSEQRPGGWRSRHDERSRLFGVRDRLAGRAPLADRMWPQGAVLDQQAEGACVGMAVVNAAASLGVAGADTEAAALSIYRRAQQLDTMPGESYTGTSVLAGLQAATEAGLFGGYLWAFGTRDIAEAVLRVGPVVVGVRWLSGMYDTGPGGLVQLEGDDIGIGHCLTVLGLRLKGPQGQPGPFFVWENSWGPDYGDGGLGYIHHRDLATLLRGIGEAAVPTRDQQAPQ